MNNQRIESWPILRFKNFRDRDPVERISRQSVNGLCWQRDDFASLQKRNSS